MVSCATWILPALENMQTLQASFVVVVQTESELLSDENFAEKPTLNIVLVLVLALVITIITIIVVVVVITITDSRACVMGDHWAPGRGQ